MTNHFNRMCKFALMPGLSVRIAVIAIFSLGCSREDDSNQIFDFDVANEFAVQDTTISYAISKAYLDTEFQWTSAHVNLNDGVVGDSLVTSCGNWSYQVNPQSTVEIWFPDALVEWFQMDRVAPLYVFGFVWLGTLIRPVFFASLRGFEMFTAWSWSHLIQSIARLGGGLFLVISVSAYAGWGLLGHGIGVFVGTSIAGITLWMCLKNEVASGQTIPPLGGYMGQSVAVWLGLAVFLVGDVVLVRRAFPEWSGLYAYAAVLGHLILVVPQSICGALFPKVVKASFTERMALYRSSAWTTLGAIVLLSLGVVVFGTFLLGLLFGPEAVTDESVRWLRYIALSLIPICYLQYTVQFALAIKQFRWLWMVLVFALVLVGFLEAGLVTSPDGLIGWMAGLALMLAVGIDCRIRRVLARESVA